MSASVGKQAHRRTLWSSKDVPSVEREPWGRKEIERKGLALCGPPIYKNTLEGLQQFDLSRSSDLSVASSV